MESKLILFDVDGTLYRRDCQVPDSAREAIEQCVKNGHHIILCTGRNHSMIPPAVRSLPISGEIEGIGTYVSFQDKVLLDAALTGEDCQKVLSVLYDCKCPFYIENADHFYYDNKYVPPVFQPIQASIHRNYPGEACYMDSFPNRMSKITGYPEDRSRLPELKERLSPWFDVIIHQEYIYIEITLKGYSKGTGVQKLLDYLGMKKEDTYGFGDSMNDLAMLESVGHPMVMGDATNYLKERFPSTSSIYHDGIKNGLEKMGLI